MPLPARRAATATFALCATLTLELAAQTRDSLEPTLAAFPDDGLPTLLGRLLHKDAGAVPALHALGPAAHEALLGAVVHVRFMARQDLAAAFGQFDARCAWALPVLTDPHVYPTQPAQDLLVLLGPAVSPFLPQLEQRARSEPHLRPLVDKLVKASDAPLPPATPRTRPQVAEALVPALLTTLREGPDNRRWPALQALLCCGDDAATEATEALLALSIVEGEERRAADLLLTVQCHYATRRLQGLGALDRVPAEDLAREARRCALSGALLTGVDAWLRSPDASLRRTAMLSILDPIHADRQRSGAGGHPDVNRPIRLPISSDPDAAVQRLIDLAVVMRRRDGARAARAVLPALGPRNLEAAKAAMEHLAGHDLRDAPEALWLRLTELALLEPPPSDPIRSVPDSSSASALARRYLSRIGQRAGPLPRAVVVALPTVVAADGHGGFARDLLEGIRDAELDAQVRAASEDPAQLAGWLAVLRAANGSTQDRVAREALLAALAPCIPNMPATAQLDWLETERKTAVPETVWRDLLQHPDVAVRRRACQAAWRGWHIRQCPLDPILALLRDQDNQVACHAALVLSKQDIDRERAIAALVEAFASADPDLQQQIAFSLWFHRDVPSASARATIDAAFASEHPRVRVHATMYRLHIDRDDAAANAMLHALLTDADAMVRQYAAFQAGNDGAVATKFVDAAVHASADRDDQVRYAACRMLERATGAPDKALQALRSLLEREPQNSSPAQRARSAIEHIERRSQPQGR